MLANRPPILLFNRLVKAFKLSGFAVIERARLQRLLDDAKEKWPRGDRLVSRRLHQLKRLIEANEPFALHITQRLELGGCAQSRRDTCCTLLELPCASLFGCLRWCRRVGHIDRRLIKSGAQLPINGEF